MNDKTNRFDLELQTKLGETEPNTSYIDSCWRLLYQHTKENRYVPWCIRFSVFPRAYNTMAAFYYVGRMRNVFLVFFVGAL